MTSINSRVCKAPCRVGSAPWFSRRPLPHRAPPPRQSRPCKRHEPRPRSRASINLCEREPKSSRLPLLEEKTITDLKTRLEEFSKNQKTKFFTNGSSDRGVLSAWLTTPYSRGLCEDAREGLSVPRGTPVAVRPFQFFRISRYSRVAGRVRELSRSNENARLSNRKTPLPKPEVTPRRANLHRPFCFPTRPQETPLFWDP